MYLPIQFLYGRRCVNLEYMTRKLCSGKDTRAVVTAMHARWSCKTRGKRTLNRYQEHVWKGENHAKILDWKKQT